MDTGKLKTACEALEGYIEMITRKRGGMSPQDIELLCKALCAMETIKRLEGGGEEYSEASHRRGRSMNSQLGYYDGSNSGRYYDGGSGNSGYSGHSKRDRLIDHLEQLMDAAQTEQERQFLRNWLDRVNNN